MNNENNGRIIKETIEVNEDSVHDFFERRTDKTLFHRYNLVNYQDNSPEIALERDKIEKTKIFPYLEVKDNSRILDIGCGVGRWGDKLTQYLSDDGKYVGVDYSENLIKVAKDYALVDGTSGKREYYVCKFQQLEDVLCKDDNNQKFDIVIINGVLMYINDKDIDICLRKASELLEDKGIIYIKEPVGIDYRLTLNDIYSEELTSRYSAIYRSISEYEEHFRAFFNNCISKGPTFHANLQNRSETTSYYWVFRKM